MVRRGKTSWRAVQAYSLGSGDDDASRARKLEGTDRIVALYRFQNGEAPADRFFGFLDDGSLATLDDPTAIEWESFPVLAALEAITYEELRRLRGLLRSDSDFPPPLA